MAGSSHGHTPAAWVGVIIALIGFTISGVYTVMAQPLGVVAGLVVVAVAGVVGLAMKAAGYGQQSPQGRTAATRSAEAPSEPAAAAPAPAAATAEAGS